MTHGTFDIKILNNPVVSLCRYMRLWQFVIFNHKNRARCLAAIVVRHGIWPNASCLATHARPSTLDSC